MSAHRPRSLALLCAAIAAQVLACAACAAPSVPVRESVPTGQAAAPVPSTGAPAAAGAADAAGEANRLGELFYQLQLLQREVQDLRGLVEEQGYQLERLARDQQEQYLDLDGRVRNLTVGGDSSAGRGAQAGGGSTRSDIDAAEVAGSERDAYTSAFNLMKDREFDESVQAFNALLARYPDGEYSANSWYWLGELHLARNDLELARQSFMQVVNLFPDNQKVADALYKLGVTHHRLGDNVRALEFLDRVRAEFSNSSAAGLASTYAAELR